MTNDYSHITVDEHDSSVVVTLQDDRITQYDSAEEIEQELMSAVGDESKRVILDFSNVAFMSSVGYRPLIQLRKHLAKHDSPMVICGLSDDLRELFTTTHLIVQPESNGFGFVAADSVLDALEMQL